MSGVLFYSRTLIIPMLLLYIVEKSIVKQNRKLFIYALLVFSILALSEIIVRASKEPFLNLALFLVICYSLLHLRNINAAQVINKKIILSIFIAALIVFPLMEIYRAVMFTQAEFGVFFMALGDSMAGTQHQDRNFIVLALKMLLDRLLGFTQMAGLIADSNFHHDYSVIFSYDSLGKYYTEYYLGYRMEGHLSSPSLLGASIILGGLWFWYLFFGIYIAFMNAIWRISSRLSNLEIPLKCLLGYELFNTTMAGTIDASLFRMVLFFGSALIIEFILTVTVPRKSKPAFISQVPQRRLAS